MVDQNDFATAVGAMVKDARNRIGVPRGADITSATDVNSLPPETTQRRIPSSAVAAASTNLPSTYAGTLTQTMTSTAVGHRTYATFGDRINLRAAGVWMSLRQSSTTWGPWFELGERTTWGNIGATASAPIDLNTYKRPGITQINNPTAIANTQNLPVDIPGTFFNAVATDNVAFSGQLYFAYGNTPEHGLYHRVSSNVSGAWHPWEKVPTMGDVEAAIAAAASTQTVDTGPYQHLMRENDMRRRRHTRVTTPGVAVLVMDHGLTNFKADIWPLLQARGIPVTLALNPAQMTSAQNAGASYADVKAWAATGLVEPANHSWNHVGGTTTADFDREIRQSREELETQLGQTIDTWVHPGNVFGDFTVTGNPAHYWATEAGRMIVASHGAVTGLVDAGLLPVGQNILGAGGGWIDSAGSTAAMQTQIGSAITARRMKIVRLHPQFLGDTGKLDVAELTTFLDWAKARVDAGDLTILTYRDAMSATR